MWQPPETVGFLSLVTRVDLGVHAMINDLQVC